MDKWQGKVALVTGASCGIGAAIAQALVRNGMVVIGAARSHTKLEELSKQLQDEKGKLVAFKCNLSVDSDIYDLYNFINAQYGGVNVCINNAAAFTFKSLLDGDADSWRYIFNVNVIAMMLSTKLAVESLKTHQKNDGYIINIGSMAAFHVHNIGIYHDFTGTKFAARAITAGFRQELKQMQSRIRVSMIHPGTVQTDALDAFIKHSSLEKSFSECEPLLPSDISDTVLFLLSSPVTVEVDEIIVKPTKGAL